MTSPRPVFSLIVPTRQRTAQLRRLLDSLAATASHPDAIEAVLVVDSDDLPSLAVGHDLIAVRHRIVSPGLSMGALNRAGCEAARGDHLMLLNDDVVVRTPGWDDKILARCRRFPDGIFLIHVNDTLMRENLCTFPLVSRTWCDLAGGICPAQYIRYRIDDHIEDVFNLLALLGQRRTIYLPDVVFEHLNAVEIPEGPREYHSEPRILALDAPRFLALFPARKELALKLLGHIEKGSSPERTEARRRLLAAIEDPFSLRLPSRLRIEHDASLLHRLLRGAGRQIGLTWKRVRRCWQQKGASGLARAGSRHLLSLFHRRAG
jgi:hypothetical protein